MAGIFKIYVTNGEIVEKPANDGTDPHELALEFINTGVVEDTNVTDDVSDFKMYSPAAIVKVEYTHDAVSLPGGGLGSTD